MPFSKGAGSVLCAVYTVYSLELTIKVIYCFGLILWPEVNCSLFVLPNVGDFHGELELNICLFAYIPRPFMAQLGQNFAL